MLVQYPGFLLELLLHPRQLLRRIRWDDPAGAVRLSLYLLLSLGIFCWGFSDSRQLAGDPLPALSSFKGIVIHLHQTRFDGLSSVYGPLGLNQTQALAIWDTMLMPRFVAWTLFATLLGIAVLARLRMLRCGLDWNHAIGTGILGLLGLLLCQGLALIPLTLLLSRFSTARLLLGGLLWLAGWFYLGYYSLADLGERPRGMLATLWRSLLYGFIQALIAGLVFWLLVLPVIPA